MPQGLLLQGFFWIWFGVGGPGPVSSAGLISLGFDSELPLGLWVPLKFVATSQEEKKNP